MRQQYIKALTRELENRIRRNPSLAIDSFVLPSPFVADDRLSLDYRQSMVWEEEREILGFMEVWSDPDQRRLHIYKQVTSPFGRSKGIGSAMLTRLAKKAPSESLIDLYVWERQSDSLTFYRRRGFVEKEKLAWRALSFIRLEGTPTRILEAISLLPADAGMAEELGKVRHDAKKAIRLIADMAGALSAENCSRIIEDINRETTALVNTLNLFRDSTQRFRTVNMKDLIIDRIVPMVEHSPVECELILRFCPGSSEARANYLEAGRAVVNLVSNALDAIRVAQRPGILSISLEQNGGWITLAVEDNGEGIDEDRLKIGPDGKPLFVGITTKAASGEGQGTRQIFAAFGAENISVRSEAGRGTRWTIRMREAEQHEESILSTLETRLKEFQALSDSDEPTKQSPETDIEAFIWRKRKLEILVWDLILQFARKNNVRELFRDVLAHRHNSIRFDVFREALHRYHTESPELRRWLIDAVRRLKKADIAMDHIASETKWQKARFQSYGQAVNRTVIFTMDPLSGSFGATDRKLAEHADYVPWLGGSRELLLRGEFFGELRRRDMPIQLGVWEINSLEDGLRKAALIREGARTLLQLGLPADKKLLFYEATWRRAGLDLDTNRQLSLQQAAELEDAELEDLLTSVDDETGEYIFSD